MKSYIILQNMAFFFFDEIICSKCWRKKREKYEQKNDICESCG